MDLTKDSLKAFKIIYCEFKKRRKAGFTKEDSRSFPDGEIDLLPSFSNWLEPDISSAVQELVSAKFLKENIWGDVNITDAGLIFMESKPREYFEDLKTLFDIIALFA